jgi:riboflavin synthase
MFTGLIEATGRIETLPPPSSGGPIRIRTTLAPELTLGESIAVNGVCLTVTSHDRESFGADVSPATLAVTTLGQLGQGRVVNLERSVRADARLGGHFVLGHVDATGRIAAIRPEGGSHWLDIDLPPVLEPLVIPHGSIAVDGISLTIAALGKARIAIQIIPFTFSHTSLAQASVGDPVNLEADVLGKYVVRLLQHQLAAVASGTAAVATP